MLFAPLELHPGDGATVAVISQLSTMCPFARIFKLHSYRVFLVGGPTKSRPDRAIRSSPDAARSHPDTTRNSTVERLD